MNKWLTMNARWSDALSKRDRTFFARLSGGQQPRLLWIGCSDSRVTPECILDVPLGTVFSCRNIGNMAQGSDTAVRACVQFGLSALHIRDLVVCGHYGCVAVRAAMQGRLTGDVRRWLEPLRGLYKRVQDELMKMSEEKRWRRLSELNVAFQVCNLGRMQSVQGLWKQGVRVRIHGWIFDLRNGRLKDLRVTVSSMQALNRLERRLLS